MVRCRVPQFHLLRCVLYRPACICLCVCVCVCVCLSAHMLLVVLQAALKACIAPINANSFTSAAGFGLSLHIEYSDRDIYSCTRMVGGNTEQYSPSSPETNPNCVVVNVQDALHLNQVTLVLYLWLLLRFAADTVSMCSCSATDFLRVLCRTPTAAHGWPSTFSCCSHSSSSSASSSTCSSEGRLPAFECGRQAVAEAV